MRIGQAISDGRERGRRHLVEQRLEQVVVAPVDDGDVDVGALQLLDGGDAAKAAADDDDAMPLNSCGHLATSLFAPSGM